MRVYYTHKLRCKAHRSTLNLHLTCNDVDVSESLPKQSSASCFPKDDRRVWWHLEISISLLDPVLLLSVH